MQQKPKQLHLKRSGSMLLLAAAIASHSHAISFDISDEASASVDFTLGYATAVRATNADLSNYGYTTCTPGVDCAPNLLSELNHPNAGDQVNQLFKAKAEIGLSWRDYGFSGTIDAQYDTRIMNEDAKGFAGEDAAWTESTENYSGQYANVVDAYVYGNFDFGDTPVEVRAGKQVINWGEGFIFLDGIAVQSPLDLNKLLTPGTELKEGIIGNDGLYTQVGIGDESSLEAYVQTSWNRTEMPPQGTFFGDDAFFRGGDDASAAYGGFPARDADVEAKDDGQFGLAFRTTLGDTEVGIYYSRYHETLPFVGLNMATWDATVTTPLASATGLHQLWPEDLDMIGASFATTVGSWSISGEAAYRPDRAMFGNLGTLGVTGEVQGNVLTNIHTTDSLTASATGIWFGSQTIMGIDGQLAFVQIGLDHVADADNLAAQNSVHLGDLTADETAMGITAIYDATWNDALGGGNSLTLDLLVQHDFMGTSHFWGNFAEDRTLGAISLIAAFGNDLEAKVGYSFTDQANSYYDTQDLYSATVNYKF